MIAEIISIGDELLVGQVVNTNATWIAQQLHSLGISVRQISDIPDDREEIKKAIALAFPRADIILMTGGLGPTRDDITKNTLCEYFNVKLVFHEPTYENIKKIFALRDYQVTEVNRKQAEIPEGCIPILNHHGTAPGMWFEKDGKVLVSMPGVPFEMEAMMEHYILPRLAGKENHRVVAHKTVQTQGVGESHLAGLINDWEDKLPENMKLAYLPQPGIVRLRLTAFGNSKEKIEAEIDDEIRKLQTIIPDLIYGYGNDTMEEVVGNLLRKHGYTVSTAESCTGGYLAHLITSIPGASDYFPGSIIAYSNEVKRNFLGVSEGSLMQFGAVSEQVVIEMANGAMKKFGTDFALAVSGVAGPDGGTIEKPVGTVWIALATQNGTKAKKFKFGEHRGRNIRRSALAALNLLRETLLESS